MKTYSIGRETTCDIVINDSTNVISRRHAIVNVTSLGKITITDQSHNGTYVNGMRINSNVPVPVTRKDSVSFAQIARLDWNLIPNPMAIYKYIAAGVVALLVVVLLFTLFKPGSTSGNNSDNDNVVTDTAKVVTPEELAEREAARRDSITKAVKDSINKENAKKQPVNKKKTDNQQVKQEKKQKDTTKPKKEEDSSEEGTHIIG